MLDLFIAQIIAAEAQRRHIDGVRLDRPVSKPSRWRSFVAALFTRSDRPAIRARTRLGRVVTA